MTGGLGTALETFDRWVARGDFTLEGLGRFRVLFATYALLRLPNFAWASSFPDALYAPPPGLMTLFDGFPPSAVLTGLELLLAVALMAVLVGWRTRPASLVVTAVLVLGHGFTYSLGKIDHAILFFLLPAFLAFAGWDGAWSVDAARERASRTVRHWVLRAYALTVGIAMATAALPKARGGWLSPDSHAVWSQLLIDQQVRQVDTVLGARLVQLDVPVLWEVVDWLTVGLEGVLIVSVLWWPLFRLVLAGLALFHLGVLLTLDIAFVGNLLAYGAFVRWDRVSLPAAGVRARVRPRLRRVPEVAMALAVTVSGIGWYLLPDVPHVGGVLRYGVTWTGAGVGAWYLARQAHRAVRAVGRSTRPAASDA
ncbi:HTTM domain-containing protein [Egicoccus halophilus]|uniref:HTTM domain-containing protein n=1 Tax=Egicoccus halophilus TaxID=1670830 RepID=A0A8J3A767_9ACTN|nr:hypothetical protein [Egicoccus halophilus]GGI05180.1 hypothetical protein GCM10011354_12810 [Egicoccus halophilus]